MKNKKIKFNKNKGFTIIEAILATSLISAGSVVAIKKIIDTTEEESQLSAFSPVSTMIKAVDQRIKIDGYDFDLWLNLNSSPSKTTEVLDFANKAFISAKNKDCGSASGWVPQIEEYDDIRLISCDFVNQKISHYDLQLKYNKNNENTLYNFDIIMKIKSKYELKNETFLTHKKLLNEMRNSDFQLEEGNVNSGFYNVNNLTNEISVQECAQINNNCVIKLGWNSDGYSESLRIDGSNNIIDDTISFSENYFEDNYKCLMWEYDGLSYKLSDTEIDCGVGIYKKTLSPVFATVDSVVKNAEVFDPIILKQNCRLYEIDGNGYLNENGFSPCGLFTGDSGASQVIQVVEEIQSDSAFLDSSKGMKVTDLVTNEISTGLLDINNDFKLEDPTSIANLNVLVIEKGSKVYLNDSVKMGVLEQLTTTEIKGDLTISDNTSNNTNPSIPEEALIVEKDVTIKELNFATEIEKDLSASTAISATLTFKNPNSISDGSYCNYTEEGDITSVGTNILQCRETNVNNVYKWSAHRFGEIQAFNSSCPQGWTKISDLEGRTAIGEGWLVDPVVGKIKYEVGDKGGKAKVRLTEAELPSHQHDYRDAYFSEHWGDTGPRNQPGDNGGQDNDNNLYVKGRTTENEGSNLAHENRMAYAAVNYCRYNEGDNKSNAGNEPNLDVDDFWYPYPPEIGQWYSTGIRNHCTSDVYYDKRGEDGDGDGVPDGTESWVRQCEVIEERWITEKEINYLTSEIRDGNMYNETSTKDVSEVWLRATPLIYDWYDIGEPYDCTHPEVNVVTVGSDYVLTLSCSVERERTYQERIAMFNSEGVALEYRNLGGIEKEQDIFQDNYLFTVAQSDSYKTCGDWKITPEENAKHWTPNAGDYDKGTNVDQTRTVEKYRLCNNKIDMFGHTYVLASFNETKNEEQSRTIKGSKINLKTWKENDSNGIWSVASDGSYAYQAKNGHPTIFTTPTNDYGEGVGAVFEGSISTANDGDDDWVGFVMGKENSNNFYVWSWKQGNQSPAVKGHVFAKVTSGVGVIPWDAHNSKSGYQVLRTDLTKGWVDNVTYKFRIEYKPKNVRLFIDGKLLFDIDGTFPSGAVGFYNNSQSKVTYYKITEEPYYE